MKGFRRLLAASMVTFGVLTSAQPVTAAQTPIHFADLNWESGSLITDVLRIIVEKVRLADGYAAGHHHHPGNGAGQQ
jgi:glycine betaine/proline transport system substrate-binding protein